MGDPLIGEQALFEREGPVFDFIVPDELLKEAVGRSRDAEAVADLALVPGTGEGKPPRMSSVMRTSGVAPLLFLTLAALVPSFINNGISLLGPNIKASFHLSDAGLGAVTFVAAVAQIGWGLPVAVWADRGSRKMVAAFTLFIFAITVPLMALSKSVWPFAFLYIIAAIGYGTSDTVHNSYLSDAYPTQARARVFAWHQLSDPLGQTVGILLIGFVAAASGSWRWSLLIAFAGIPIAFAILTLREPDKGANESSHILRA
ncbi:MAG TPA: MFS transporter, partial [Acidimicrobiales bacterium]|nr:MFS transporter [Acidimicrobiales bacterium]